MEEKRMRKILRHIFFTITGTESTINIITRNSSMIFAIIIIINNIVIIIKSYHQESNLSQRRTGRGLLKSPLAQGSKTYMMIAMAMIGLKQTE